MPTIIQVRASALRANGESVMLVISGENAAHIFDVTNADELADSLTHALMGREDYRAHIRRMMQLEQLMGRGQ